MTTKDTLGDKLKKIELTEVSNAARQDLSDL